MNKSDYTISKVYITLTSINLFSSPINSFLLRIINIENNLALSGSVPYS